MTDLSISEFKAVCDTLGRFADIRETAKEPRDRVLAQVGGGRLKFIAGGGDSTVIVDVGPAEGKAKAVVKSRLLLNAAKALRGRGEVEIEVDRGGCFLRASSGGKVTLSAFTTLVPDFVRPPKKQEAQTVVKHPGFTLASKVFPTVTSKHHPSDKVYLTSGNSELAFTGTDQRSYARWVLPVKYDGEPWSLGALPAAMFRALSDLKEPGPFAWGDGRVAIRSGRFLVGARLVPEALPWPLTVEPSDEVRIQANRKQLIDALKSMAGGDTNHRVRLRAGRYQDDFLAVENWEGEGAMDISAVITGAGRVGVDADRMRKLLTALPGKSVNVEFEGTRPGVIRLMSEEAEGWQTLLAPVV